VVDPDTGEVRAGPRVDLADVVSLHGLGDVVLAATSDGWAGVDRTTGELRWASRFPVRDPVAYRGAMYGFEHRSAYALGERTPHVLYRLDPTTGAVSEVPLPAPAGAEDADGYGWSATATAFGLLAAFVRADGTRCTVLLDPAAGTVDLLPFEPSGTARPSPSGRYVMWGTRDGGVIRDAAAPGWPVVARPALAAEYALPLVEVGLIVAIDDRDRRLCFHDLEGTRTASWGGIGTSMSYSTAMFATARGAAVLTSSWWDAVRRWPVPVRAS